MVSRSQYKKSHKSLKIKQLSILLKQWHIRWFINSADLMFDRSALYGLSNQLSFDVPVTGSESNIKTAQR